MAARSALDARDAIASLGHRFALALESRKRNAIRPQVAPKLKAPAAQLMITLLHGEVVTEYIETAAAKVQPNVRALVSPFDICKASSNDQDVAAATR